MIGRQQNYRTRVLITTGAIGMLVGLRQTGIPPTVAAQGRAHPVRNVTVDCSGLDGDVRDQDAQGWVEVRLNGQQVDRRGLTYGPLRVQWPSNNLRYENQFDVIARFRGQTYELGDGFTCIEYAPTPTSIPTHLPTPSPTLPLPTVVPTTAPTERLPGTQVATTPPSLTLIPVTPLPDATPSATPPFYSTETPDLSGGRETPGATLVVPGSTIQVTVGATVIGDPSYPGLSTQVPPTSGAAATGSPGTSVGSTPMPVSFRQVIPIIAPAPIVRITTEIWIAVDVWRLQRDFDRLINRVEELHRVWEVHLIELKNLPSSDGHDSLLHLLEDITSRLGEIESRSRNTRNELSFVARNPTQVESNRDGIIQAVSDLRTRIAEHEQLTTSRAANPLDMATLEMIRALTAATKDIENDTATISTRIDELVTIIRQISEDWKGPLTIEIIGGMLGAVGLTAIEEVVLHNAIGSGLIEGILRRRRRRRGSVDVPES